MNTVNQNKVNFPYDYERSRSARGSLTWIWWLLAGITIAYLIFLIAFGIVMNSSRFVYLVLIVDTSAISIGGLIGFLFGLPKNALMASQTAATKPLGSMDQIPYQANNNLEQVSDWLTKILIGVGLVEINQLGGVLLQIGAFVEKSLQGGLQGASIVVQASIILFCIVGFIGGFLWSANKYLLIVTANNEKAETLASLRNGNGAVQPPLQGNPDPATSQKVG